MNQPNRRKNSRHAYPISPVQTGLLSTAAALANPTQTFVQPLRQRHRMTYYMSFAIMVHLGFRTHEGVPLTKLPYFVQRFEAGLRSGGMIFYSSATWVAVLVNSAD